MKIESWGPYSSSELEDQMNIGKFLVLNFLLAEGVIKEEVYKKVVANYAIIIQKPSFFNKIWRKVLKDADHPRFILVEQKSFQFEQDEKEEVAQSAEAAE